MGKPLDLTAEAREGWGAPDGAECPHYWSSPAFEAWKVGRFIKGSGYGCPTKARSSRGSRVVTDKGAFTVEYHGDSRVYVVAS